MFFVTVFHQFLNLHKRRRRRLELMPQGFLPWGYDMNHLYLKYGRRYVGVLCALREVTNMQITTMSFEKFLTVIFKDYDIYDFSFQSIQRNGNI